MFLTDLGPMREVKKLSLTITRSRAHKVPTIGIFQIVGHDPRTIGGMLIDVGFCWPVVVEHRQP